ncbi:MAG: hypothetical protein HZC36_13850 [Armatimonadetes bacterium]|nr:hypothetical protein [Armatimonadota bacterium]
MKLFNGILVSAALFGLVGAPMLVQAQTDAQIKHRQKTKNDWRDLGYLSGAAGLFGLLKGDKTLVFVGTAGALYSASRYEHDRKSQSKMKRARATLFSRKSFTRNGVRYVRHTTTKNGKKYYYFAKA